MYEKETILVVDDRQESVEFLAEYILQPKYMARFAKGQCTVIEGYIVERHTTAEAPKL